MLLTIRYYFTYGRSDRPDTFALLDVIRDLSLRKEYAMISAKVYAEIAYTECSGARKTQDFDE